MTEVVSVKFKNRGKCYFFAPGDNQIKNGDSVVVETVKGLELAECCRGNHPVEDNAVVQPLRPVVRIATDADLRVAEINKKREKEAFDICEKKITEHGLDMKLVDVECNFEGNKTTFFFTSDGRVDFRELVKDLAGIFRNRIELRQIGVRDEAKMLGGLGICGRPYCCSQFLDDFEPVSTKMAKVQNLSLNPTKISGSCGRLMCCLRYEQNAYEDLVSKVPKLGAFVETPAGYGTVSQVNLLRQTVKVRIDGNGEAVIKSYDADEVAAIPGGRPKDGEAPVSILKTRPKPIVQPEEPVDIWKAPVMLVEDEAEKPVHAEAVPVTPEQHKPAGRHHRGGRGGHKPPQQGQKPEATTKPAAPKSEKAGEGKPKSRGNYYHRSRKPRPKSGGEPPKA